MNAEKLKDMFLFVSDSVIAQKEELCRLDSFVGDGDHGLTVEKGFRAVKQTLSSDTFSSAGEIVSTVGSVLADTMGGAIGLIIGGLFEGGQELLKEKENFDVAEFDTMFSEGLSYIQEIGGAKEGDRTLVDALAPASRAFSESAASGNSLNECILSAAKAARAGAKNTENMVAKCGRAKFLQDKSKGFVDAGATTMAIIVEAMSSYINK